MKKLLTAAAVASALATATVVTPSFADNHESLTMFITIDQQTDVRASNLIGKTIYNADVDLNDDLLMDESGVREWDDIGEVEDLVLTRDGKLKGVIVGVGGFLDIGDKSVSISMDKLKFINDKDSEGNYFLAVSSTKEQLTNAPAYDSENQSGQADMAAMLIAPEVSYEGYSRTDVSQLTAEQLENNYVYGSNNETVGEIDELLLDANGKLEKAVINVGGFLGMGEKPVAVSFDRLTLLKEDGGDEIRVYIESTEEKLESMPEYGG